MRMHIKPMVKDFIYPVYKTAGAAAFDIFLQQDLTLTPDEPVTIKLGFATGMEDGYYAEIVPRSSVGMKYGVSVWNTVGIIDSDFEGEWCAKLDCKIPCSFKRGDRILQCVIHWGCRAMDIDVENNPRGKFSGSTGA